MMTHQDPARRQPKGDHNRRLAMGIGPEDFAAEAGITEQALRDYERTAPDHTFDVEVARLVGLALDRLEQVRPNSEAAGIDPVPGGGANTHRPGTGMDHSTHVRLSPEEITSERLEGAPIYGADNQKVGQVSHLHGSGPGAHVIIDVGGFLGIGAKPVAVPTSDLDIMRDESGKVHAVTDWTKDSLERMPEHHHH